MLDKTSLLSMQCNDKFWTKLITTSTYTTMHTIRQMLQTQLKEGYMDHERIYFS